MTAAVDRQQSADDHRGAGGHGPDAGLGLRVVRLVRPAAAGRPPGRGSELINCSSTTASNCWPPSNSSGSAAEVGHRRDGHGGIEGVVGLDRAAARGVRVEQDAARRVGDRGVTCHRLDGTCLARCRATMPPDRLRHSTSSPPGRGDHRRPAPAGPARPGSTRPGTHRRPGWTRPATRSGGWRRPGSWRTPSGTAARSEWRTRRPPGRRRAWSPGASPAARWRCPRRCAGRTRW